MMRTVYTTRTVYMLLMIFAVIALQGQNLLDSQGRKTGPWKTEYENGMTRYEGTFREGRPFGLMIRYYDTGDVQARMVFSPDGMSSRAELFHENGSTAAKGNYVGRVKDSVWNYYSETDGSLRLKEIYVDGVLHGKVCSYYPDSTVSEEITWKHGSREGSWVQYYEDGTVRLRSTYVNDRLNGPYQVFHPNTALVISGFFEEDISQGTWMFYDESGDLIDSMVYRNGSPVDQEKFTRIIMEDSLLNQEMSPVESTFQE
jgi:antitoxin component YwqK of YwqJK toxin-antitoxin module